MKWAGKSLPKSLPCEPAFRATRLPTSQSFAPAWTETNAISLRQRTRSIARRANFEVSQDNPSEISPGVIIVVKKLNVDKQQINGWVYLPDEHRTLWLNKHGLLEPITFYGEQDKQQRDIIITRVTDNDAVGYVLTPKSPAASAANHN